MFKFTVLLILISGLGACSHFANSSHVKKDIRQPASNNLTVAEIEDRIANTVYDQAVGTNFKHSTGNQKGRLDNPSALAVGIMTPMGRAQEVHNSSMILTPASGDWIFASGLTIDILKYAALRLSEEFNPDDYKMYVELSTKRSSPRYKSHANGLDIALTPLIKVDGRLVHPKNLRGEKSAAYLTAILSVLDETKRIHAVFAPSWVKSYIEKPDVSYPIISQRNFGNLTVRVVCNQQNPRCVGQGVLRERW